jgi:cell division protein FtsN
MRAAGGRHGSERVDDKPKSRVVMIGLAAGLVAGVVGILVVLSMSGKETPPAEDATAAVEAEQPSDAADAAEAAAPEVQPGRPAEEPAAEPAAAGPTQLADSDRKTLRAKLSRIEARIDPTLTAYEGIREDLLGLARKVGGTSGEAEVQRVLGRVDADYAKLATEALEEAKKAGRELASRGEVDSATSVIRSVRRRFSDGPWLKSGGGAAVDMALAQVKGDRDSAAEVAIAMAKDALDSGDMAAARKALQGRSKWSKGKRDEANGLIRRISDSEKKTASARNASKPKPKPKPAQQKSQPKKPSGPSPIEEPTADLPGGPAGPLPGETGKPGQWAPGLICEIFRGDLRTRAAVRIDPNIDSRHGSAPPDLGDYGDVYFQRWTGMLFIPVTAEYVLKLKPGRSQMDLHIDGSHAATAKGRDKVSQPLALGEGMHEIKIIQRAEQRAGAEAHLEWVGSGLKGAVSKAFLYHKVPDPGKMGPFAKLVPGGLKAEYFGDDKLGKPVAASVTRTTTFDVKDGTPCTAVPSKGYSLRYSGYIQTSGSGKPCGFELSSDDSVKLVVNGQTVIDEWESRGKKDKKTGTVQLGAGMFPFVLEYRHKSGNSYCRLKWAPGGGNRYSEIPASALYREAGGEQIVSRSGYAPGLSGAFYGGQKPAGKVFAKLATTSLNVRWGRKPPHPMVPPDSYSAVWTGKLLVPVAGLYEFSSQQKGGLIFAVAGRPVISEIKSKKKGRDQKPGSVKLRAGANPVKMIYIKHGGDAEFKISWRGPGFGDRPIGPESLVHSGRLAMAKPWRPGMGLADLGVVGGAGAGVGGGGRAPAVAGGNRVRNAGFEERNDDTKFAASWSKSQWGDRGLRYSVRLDRTDPHSGTYALSARALESGARPGAQTTLALDPGAYEIRFWACAGFEATANVGVHLSGRDLPEIAVGDEWKQYKFTTEIEKKNRNASLRIWTSTERVRVLFDDIEVECVR